MTLSVTRPAAPARSGRRRRVAGSSLGLLLILLVGVAAPLVAVLVRAVTGYDGQPSALGELADPANLRILTNTVLLGVMVVAFSTLLAAPLAFVMSWTTMRDHRWIDVAIMIPFMTPPYVASLAWLDFTRVNGLAEQLFGSVGTAISRGIQTPAGMALIMACEVFPFLYLILRNHLDTLPASSDEMARIAGASAWQRFTRILAPLTSSSFSLGALIVFIRAAGEFGAPVTIGNQIGFPVLVSKVYADVTIDPLDFPSAAAFSSVLLALGVTVWGLQQWIGRNPTPFGGRASRRTTVSLGPARVAGWAWFGVVALLAIVIPYVSVVLGAMTMLRSQSLSLSNLTFDYFGIVLRPGGGLEALLNSAGFSLVSATLSTVIGVAVALVIARRRTATSRVIDMLAVAPDTVPAIVLAIGFIFFWNARWLPATPYNTGWMLVIAYTIIFLPMVVQNVKSARSGIDNRLLEAATMSGAGPWSSFRRITLPLLVPGIVSGWLLAFLIGIREVVLSSLVRPASMDLLSPWIISEFDQGHRAEAMAMTVIGVVGSTIVLVVIEAWRRRQSEKRFG
ncbi:ABC transporter permease [Microbacterium sorbitolivorans]|uniref:Iron ABC transporter permease n=1 Tax=Microbacterium sorbitolivorans TaxID=1867410 RepID=A0A367Y3J1_9MICO|nr:iron ABC transporter permease [Microbacterium sorbitolivorans]RCK60179.1 iron ABC transporter permease [Microbacterium sorbitolivorans]GGF48606.1 ABC transporter permease [Microbacterium sorbitolivorans]